MWKKAEINKDIEQVCVCVCVCVCVYVCVCVERGGGLLGDLCPFTKKKKKLLDFSSKSVLILIVQTLVSLPIMLYTVNAVEPKVDVCSHLHFCLVSKQSSI